MKAKNIITAAFIALTSLTSCQKSKAETVEQYAIVQMGNYQQDGQTKEPINWIVLTQDGDRVLLMSRDLLSSQPWDVTGTNLTYAGSSIRQWLNNEFTANAFTSEENDAIIPVELDKNGKFELIAVKRGFSEWIRVSGVLVDDPDVEPQKEYLKRNPQFANSYQPGDGNMAMLYITNATARFCSFTGKPERSINF